MTFVIAPAWSSAFFGSVNSTSSKSSVARMATRIPFNLFPCIVNLFLVLQRHLISSSRGSDGHLCSLQDLQDASPPSLFAPALIATGHRLPRSEAFGKLAPRRTRPHDPQDAFHDQTMLDGGTTGGGLLGQERPQLFPALRPQG